LPDHETVPTFYGDVLPQEIKNLPGVHVIPASSPTPARECGEIDLGCFFFSGMFEVVDERPEVSDSGFGDHEAHGFGGSEAHDALSSGDYEVSA
jgi:hypothetical protein